MSAKLSGKTAVVTDASKGIGAAIAKQLVAEAAAAFGPIDILVNNRRADALHFRRRPLRNNERESTPTRS